MLERQLNLQLLPVELLYEIYIFAHSHALPHASKYLHAVFKSAPSSVQAQYLISCHLARPDPAAHRSTADLIEKALRYPLCTQPVLEALLRSPLCPSITPSPRTSIELPRRLFRSLSSRASTRWSPEDHPLPLLRYIYSDPRIPTPNANSWDGYALTKAAAAGFTRLVRFLLDHEASPACKNGLAIFVAIRRRDLALVKMLIEPDGSAARPESTENAWAPTGSKRVGKLRRDGNQNAVEGHDRPRSAKKRRLEDRVPVNQEMLKTAVRCDARDIVEYLVKEKGCVPDMQTVLMMGG